MTWTTSIQPIRVRIAFRGQSYVLKLLTSLNFTQNWTQCSDESISMTTISGRSLRCGLETDQQCGHARHDPTLETILARI